MRKLLGIVAIVGMLLSSSAAMVGAAPVLPPWRAETPFSSESATLTIGDMTIRAEIADTPELRSRGLGYRDGLRPGWGMIFAYDKPELRSFWMKGMRFCLDIIWIEHDQIVGAAESVCPMPDAKDGELPVYRSPEPVRYVLELPAGWIAAHTDGAGTPVAIKWPDDAD